MRKFIRRTYPYFILLTVLFVIDLGVTHIFPGISELNWYYWVSCLLDLIVISIFDRLYRKHKKQNSQHT